MRGERRWRSSAVGLGAVTLLASLFTAGCGRPEPKAAERVCVDENNVVREDRECEEKSSHHSRSRSRSWYYLPRGVTRPAKGAVASGGSKSKPTVVRGGFGGSSSGTSGG